MQFQGRNRQSGEQNNSSDKDNKSEGAIHNNNRHHGESGRGRGSREDRWNDRKPGGRGLLHVLCWPYGLFFLAQKLCSFLVGLK